MEARLAVVGVSKEDMVTLALMPTSYKVATKTMCNRGQVRQYAQRSSIPRKTSSQGSAAFTHETG